MMVTVNSVILLVLCLNTTISQDMLRPNIPHNSCLKQTLSEIVVDVEYLTIYWSYRIDDGIKDEILEVFIDKMKSILTNSRFETSNNWHMNRNSDTILLVASTMLDITDGISSLRNKSGWSRSGMSKLIVLYLDKTGKERRFSTDTFFKDVFQTLANLNAFNVHIIYKFVDGIYEFTWFPYEDSNCDTINRVRLISECEFGFYRNYLKILNKNKLESECTITAAVQSYEPYSFNSNDYGFEKGVEIDLVKEWARWSHLNVELKASDKINSTDGVKFKEK